MNLNFNEELFTQVLRITPENGRKTTVEIEAMEGCGFDGGTYAILKIANEQGDHRVCLNKENCAILGQFLLRWARMKERHYS